MEGLLVLLGLVVLAIPIAVVYLLIAQSGLRKRIGHLEGDIARLMAGQTAPKSTTDVAAPKPAENVSEAPDPTPEPVPSKDQEVVIVTPDGAHPQPAAARVVAARKAAAKEPSGPNRVDMLLRWIAANWFYVVSALSLALAGLFLVQYGVENGLLPPAARVLAAMGFGGALIGAGEWIRRRFGDGPDTTTAYLPSVFSGAGLVSLFGGVVAARLLYDLIGVEVAFVGMAAVGLLGVVLGWLHGPLLTAVGVIGAFVAPMLVGSTVPVSYTHLTLPTTPYV